MATQRSTLCVWQLKVKTDPDGQYVRLPEELIVQGGQLYGWCDPMTGNVILSPTQPRHDWAEFFALLEKGSAPDGFMSDRPLNKPMDPRGVFDDEWP